MSKWKAILLFWAVLFGLLAVLGIINAGLLMTLEIIAPLVVYCFLAVIVLCFGANILGAFSKEIDKKVLSTKELLEEIFKGE